MRAVRSADRQVSLAELPEPAPGPDEVLVRVAAAAVCTTDRKLAASAHPPRVPGHEVAGWLPDGTPVGVHPDVGCGRCDACLAGAGVAPAVSIGIDRDGDWPSWSPSSPGTPCPWRHRPGSGAAAGTAGLLRAGGRDRRGARRRLAGVVVGAGAMGVLATWVLGGGEPPSP